MRYSVLLIWLLAILTCFRADARAQWVQTNGPFGADIALLGSDGKTAYCCTARLDSLHRGIYRSTDGGTSWTGQQVDLPVNLYVNSLAVRDSAVIVSVYGYYAYSSDIGDHWTVFQLPAFGAKVYSIVLADPVSFMATNGGVLRSTNGGRSWTTADSGLPASSNLVAKAFLVTDSLVLVSTNSGVYGSSDRGERWAKRDQGLPSTPGGIAAFASLGGVFYAGGGDGVYASNDNGLHWYSYSNGIIPYPSTNVVALALLDTTLVAAVQSSGVYRLTGSTWTPWDAGLADLDVKAACTAGANLLVATSSQGVERVSAVSDAWRTSNAGILSGSSVGSLLTVGTRVFAPKAGFAAYTDDAGSTWTDLPIRSVDCFTSIGPYVIAGTADSGFYRSSDLGLTWEHYDAPPFYQSYVYEIIPLSGSLVECSQTGLFRSSDSGATWTDLNVSGIGPAMVRVGGSLFSSQYHDIFRSDDSGTTWNKTVSPPWIKASIDVVFGTQLASYGRYLFASTNDYGATTLQSQVFRSSDGGATWTDVNIGFPPVTAIAGEGPLLLLGAQGWIFASLDSGLSWISIGTTVEGRDVTAFGADDTYVYAGIDSKNVWRRPIAEILGLRVHQAVSDGLAVSLFPMPCGERLSLSLTTLESGACSFRLVDMLGRKVMDRPLGSASGGADRFTIDLDGIPEGTYECIVSVGERSVRRTVVRIGQ